jgi:hypothetical protein
MPDIRFFRTRASRLWLWTGGLALIAIAVWAWGTFGRDPTAEAERPQIGQALNFGADRAPVLPVFPTPFDSIAPLDTRDLGAYVHLRGTAESGLRRNAVWTRATDGRRILVRFEPAPEESAVQHVRSGGSINVSGYVQKIAVAEFQSWMDSLGVRIPRPAPGVKFGDLPDPAFARLDSLFVKEYYVSVRPEGVRGPNVEVD